MKKCRLDDALDGLNLIRSLKREPKCLTCGGARVQTPLITNQEPWREPEKPKRTGFLHPGCGGEIWMIEDGLRIGLRPSVKRYSTDGLLVSTEDIGGYTLPRREYYIRRDVQNAKARHKHVPAILLTALR